MEITSSVANLDISRVESLSTSINAAFGLHHEDPSFESDSSSSDSDSDARFSEERDHESASNEEAGETYDPEATLSAIEDEYEHEETLKPTEDAVDVIIGEKDMDISTVAEDTWVDVPQKPESLGERNERLTNELKEAFGVLAGLGTNNKMCDEHFKRDRVIVDVPYILEIFNNGCQHSSCSGKSKVQHLKKEGGVLKIWWNCSNGHFGCWSSSKELCQKHGQSVYTNSLLIASGIFRTGNNYDKLALFCRFLGLELISKATYNRMQTHYIIPEVLRYWEQMKNEIWDTLSGESVILCGDGRNDSPGFSAKYCMYAMMEQYLDIIVDVEVVDKRQTGGVSTNMEVFGLKKILERMVGEILISEVVTDASSAVIALVRTMKEKHPKEFGDLFRALDVWHKSVKLSKKLAKAAKIKDCQAIADWSEAIRNHFWFVCQECNGDVEKLKDNWFGVLHHIAGEHEWVDGECAHRPLVATEIGKTYLDKNSKAFEEIRKVVLDQKFLKSFQHYVTFRHTSKLENFNSMLLKYAPKRVGYQNDAFVGRTYLAAIDHNSHTFRKAAFTKDGKPKMSKVFSKRSNNWRVTTVRESKSYEFWPTIAIRILKRRIDDEESVLRRVECPMDHPKNLAESIAMKPIPKTSDLVAQSLSRFNSGTLTSSHQQAADETAPQQSTDTEQIQ